MWAQLSTPHNEDDVANSINGNSHQRHDGEIQYSQCTAKDEAGPLGASLDLFSVSKIFESKCDDVKLIH